MKGQHKAETKVKMRLAQTGSKNHFYGKKHSEETKLKIKLAKLGKKMSLENIEKNRISHIGLNTWSKGRKCTKEEILKMSKIRLGENNVNWKGGITPENEKARTSLEMKLWKKACMERDLFTCQVTGQKGGDLVVHHINNFADFPELRTALHNGITLSKKIHLEFHKIYGFKNNSREQLLDFSNKKYGNII